MDLPTYLIASLAAFALLEFLWIPSLQRRLALDRTSASIPKYALLSVLQVLRSVLLITTLTTAVIVILLVGLRWWGGTTPEQVATTLTTIRGWRTALNNFSQLWGATVSVL